VRWTEPDGEHRAEIGRTCVRQEEESREHSHHRHRGPDHRCHRPGAAPAL